jgi:tetratricopeptide (TPR) repeat protein
MVALEQSGELVSTPLPRLLLDLYQARFDGRLLLVPERAEKSILFQTGEPVVAESNLASESLGVRLLDAGRITRDDHTRVSAQMQAKSCKEGVALLELGLIEPKELFIALKDQVRSRLLDCFAWPNGRFETDPADAAPEGAQPFRADVFSLCQEGIETHWSTDRVLADLAPHMDLPVARNRRLQRIQERLLWDDDVQAFIDALDGGHTLWQALEAGRSARARAAAWVLHTVHAIEYRDPNVAGQDETPRDVEIVLTDVAAAALQESERPDEAKEMAAVVDTALLGEIEKKFQALGELDHYALLGVAANSDSATLRSAYLEAAKRFHPDALASAGLDAEARGRAGKVFAAIGRAHSVLSNPNRRREYDTHLALDETDLDAERLAAAETNFLKAEILLRQGNYRGAIEFLQPAVNLWPEEPEYQSALGWSLYKKNPPDLEGAYKHLEIARQLAPNDAKTAERLSIVQAELDSD